MRWIKEFFRPSLKCKRLDHTLTEQERCRYEWPGKEYRSVADEVLYTRVVCGRCGELLDDWKQTSREGIQSLSMPDDRWRLLKKQGYVSRRT